MATFVDATVPYPWPYDGRLDVRRAGRRDLRRPAAVRRRRATAPTSCWPTSRAGRRGPRRRRAGGLGAPRTTGRGATQRRASCRCAATQGWDLVAAAGGGRRRSSTPPGGTAASRSDLDHTLRAAGIRVDRPRRVRQRADRRLDGPHAQRPGPRVPRPHRRLRPARRRPRRPGPLQPDDVGRHLRRPRHHRPPRRRPRPDVRRPSTQGAAHDHRHRRVRPVRLAVRRHHRPRPHGPAVHRLAGRLLRTGRLRRHDGLRPRADARRARADGQGARRRPRRRLAGHPHEGGPPPRPGRLPAEQAVAVEEHRRRDRRQRAVRADPRARRAGLGDRARGGADRRRARSSTSPARGRSTPPTSTCCCAATASPTSSSPASRRTSASTPRCARPTTAATSA